MLAADRGMKGTCVEDSLAYYKKSGGAKRLNKIFRGQSVPIDDEKLALVVKDKLMRKHITNIDSAMKNDESLKDIPLYRGFSEDLETIINEQGVLVNKAYTSCTTKFDVAKLFASLCCVITFTVPDEIKFYNYNDSNFESEVLLQRNTQFVNFARISPGGETKIYSCIAKLYAVPIVTKKDQEKQEALEEQKA